MSKYTDIMKYINKCLLGKEVFDKYQYRSMIIDLPYEDRYEIRKMSIKDLSKLNSKIFDYFNRPTESKKVKNDEPLESIYNDFWKYYKIARNKTNKIHLEKILGSDFYQNIKELDQETKAIIWESLHYYKDNNGPKLEYIGKCVSNGIKDLIRKNSSVKRRGSIVHVDVEKIGIDSNGNILIEKEEPK